MSRTAWRLAVFLLALGNALFFAWTRGWLDGIPAIAHESEREPERLRHQIRADAVRIAPPSAASATPAAAAASVAVAAAPQPTLACLEAGPFAAHEMAQVARELEGTGIAAGRWQAASAPASPSWWVYMGRYADAEVLARKTEELKRLNVRYQVVRAPAPLQPGLLLARFDDDTAAEAELARLIARGVRTARVLSVTGEPGLQMLRIGDADTAAAERLAAQKFGDAGRAFGPCAAPLSAAASAPQAASAASPAAAGAASTPGLPSR